MAKRDGVTVTGMRRSLGYLQITTAQLQAAITLPQAIAAWIAANPTSPLAKLVPNTPAGTPGALAAEYIGYAIIQQNAAAASIRWADDGVTVPTALIGMSLGNAELDYVGQMEYITFIVQSGNPILDINLYD